MYLEFYGFSEPAFELTPNPKFLFFSAGHREALSTLQYGIASRKALTVLLGEAGTGKTTLIRSVLRTLGGETSVFQITNPTLTRTEFVESLARGFGLSERAAQSKAVLLEEIESTLLHRRHEGRYTALVVDEAQSLSDEILEEIRLLANIDTDCEKLLPVVLVGQPELRERLNQPHLRQLKQRIALRCELRPFVLDETAAYIGARVQTAGADSTQVFTREAVELVHERSAGIPRTISVLCDNALVNGFAANQRPVNRELIEEVCADFDLGPRAASGPVAAPRETVIATPAARSGSFF